MNQSATRNIAVDTKDRSLRLLLFIMLAAFAIRLVVVYCYYHQLPDVDKDYEQFGWEVGWVARAWASGHGFTSPFFPLSGPTAMVPPLYTALLAGVFRLFGVYTLTSGFIILSINSLFSALTCIPIYFSAKYSLGARAAKIAAWAWAFYPFAIYFSAGRVWEYSLTVLLFTTCFCIAQRIHRSCGHAAWIGFGVLFGITALSNPAVLSMLPLLLAIAMWQAKQQDGQRSFRVLLNGALTLAAVVLVLTPWTIRNYKVMHVLCPVRDNFWHEFYAANYGDTFDLMPPEKHPASNPVEMKKFLAMGEVAYIADAHKLAVDYVGKHPGFFVGLTLRRIVYYWTGFWSFSPAFLEQEPTELPMMFYVISVTLLMVRGIYRFWHEDRTALLPYLVLIFFSPLSYYISHPLMDFRQPIEPAIIVLAIAGAVPFRRMRAGEWIGAKQAIPLPDRQTVA